MVQTRELGSMDYMNILFTFSWEKVRDGFKLSLQMEKWRGKTRGMCSKFLKQVVNISK